MAKFLDSSGVTYLWQKIKAAFVADVTYDTTNKKLKKTKNGSTTDLVTAATIVTDGGGITSHQSIKTLDTTATTSQATSSSEAIAGSGSIKLHKIAKTGSWNDLVDKPDGAFNYVGTTSSTMTDGQTTDPTVTGVTSFKTGDIVIDATSTEFVLVINDTPSAGTHHWNEFGDASDIAKGVTAYSWGDHAQAGYAMANNVVNSIKFTGDSYITVSPTSTSKGTVEATVSHAAQTAYSAKGTSTKVPQITTNAAGHVTAITEVDIQFPSESSTKNVIGASNAATADAATTNTTTFLNHVQGSTVRSHHQIKGAGIVSVEATAAGVLTITGTEQHVGDVVSVTGEKGVTASTSNGAVTVKASLVAETANTAASSRSTSADGGLYAVELDKNNKLAVRVPWTDTVDTALSTSEIDAAIAAA